MERSHRDLLSLLAFFYLRHERPEKARVLYALLDVLAPGDVATMKGLTLALIQAGKADRALAVIERLEARDDGGASVHLLRGQALRATGRTDEAGAAIARYLAVRDTA